MHNHHLKCTFFSLFFFLGFSLYVVDFFYLYAFCFEMYKLLFIFLAITLQFVWFDVYGIIPTHPFYKSTKNLKYIFLSFYHIIVILIYLIHWFCFLEFLSLPLYESIDKDVLFIFTFLKMKKKAWINWQIDRYIKNNM